MSRDAKRAMAKWCVVLLVAILVMLGIIVVGCADRVEVERPGDWSAIYMGTIDGVVSMGVDRSLLLYKAIVPEENITVYIAVNVGGDRMSIAALEGLR